MRVRLWGAGRIQHAGCCHKKIQVHLLWRVMSQVLRPRRLRFRTLRRPARGNGSVGAEQLSAWFSAALTNECYVGGRLFGGDVQLHTRGTRVGWEPPL